jgi:hypothetical protein
MAYAPPRKRRAKAQARAAKLGRPASRRTPKPTRRRALELLAGCGAEGCSEAIMVAHGFSVEEMVDLVREGLATAVPSKVKAGGQTMEVTRLRITDAGWRAFEAAKA